MHPLQQLHQQYAQLVEQVTQGVLPGDQAQSTLESMTIRDANGAVWGIDVYGNFQRAEFAGAPFATADPATFADTPTAPTPPPGPAFPSPFPGPVGGFDGATDTALGLNHAPFADPDPVGGPGPQAAPEPHLRSLADANTPKRSNKVLDMVKALAERNKPVAIFVLVGLMLVIAAVVVPRLSGTAGTDVPSDTMPTTAATGGVPPAATADVPSTSDARVVIDSLSSGSAQSVQAMIVTPLDAPTLLRVQAAWRGAAELEVVTTPGPAAVDAAGAIVEQWDLTPPGATAPTASVTVTWVREGDAWKLANAPTF